MWFHTTYAQETISPAAPQTKPVYLTNATIHVGNGQVIEKKLINSDFYKPRKYIYRVGPSISEKSVDTSIANDDIENTGE